MIVAEVHASITRRVRSERVSWLTSEIKTEMCHGDYLKKMAVKTGSNSVEVIANSITNIPYKSIKQGIFPNDFKITCISPGLKGNSKEECSK